MERSAVSLDKILEMLVEHRRVVISGLPGVGKSELASQVIEKAIEGTKTYKGIFWLSAASEAALDTGIYEMSRELNLLDGSTVGIKTARQMVLNELNKQDHWLMVVDNVDNVDLIQGFLPIRRGARHILMTTRYREAHSAINGHSVILDEMTDGEASILFSKVFHNARNLPETEFPVPEDTCAVTTLVKELGCLPLAIIQAAAYLRACQDDVSNYIRIYRQARDTLWEWKPTQGKDYISVATVMALSFQKFTHRQKSIRLFGLISYFAPDNIPELLWTSNPRFQDHTL